MCYNCREGRIVRSDKQKEGIFLKKADFIKTVAQKSGMTQKAVDAVIGASLETIRKALKDGDSVTFLQFGSFKISKRAARKGRNPATNESIDIPASRSIAFKPGKSLKDAMEN